MKTFILALGFITLVPPLARAAATVVQVDKPGRRLLVSGQPFTMKGVNYAPTRAGGRPSNYNLFTDPQTYNNDFPLLKTMGANTLRVFDARNATTAALDAAHSNGLFVIMGYPVDRTADLSTFAARSAVLSGVSTLVSTFKDHPAVLMWSIGNEVMLENQSAIANPATWYSLLDEAAIQAHSLDPFHPVTTANQDLTHIGVSTSNTAGSNPANVDLWGATLYRGSSFGAAFTDFAARSDKPLWIAEFGSDSYNGATQAEDQAKQSADLDAQWREIEANLSAEISGKVLVGGCVFEWSDEWWKGSTTPFSAAGVGGGGPNGDTAQDVTTDFTNAAYSDPNMNEEWWGITGISSTTVGKRLRSGFYTLKNLWAPIPVTAGVVFDGPVQNFPNPLVTGGSTSIRFNVFQTPENVKVDIFDAGQKKIISLASRDIGGGLLAADWNGKDENGTTVSSGLYWCRIQIEANDRTEVKYRKIVVVK